jgi:twitching motility protein PilT
VLDLDELLRHLVDERGSDLHIKVGAPPHIRIDGELTATPFESVTPADAERLADLIPALRTEEFAVRAEADFAYGVSGLGRFRVNVFRQRGSISMVLRRVPPGAPAFEDLGLPLAVRRLVDEEHGLVLVTGPRGSGRSNTTAAMVDHINATRTASIVTIEDPIEFLHHDKRSIISQREVGTDTSDYADAMRRVQRQDPDVIFIGELVDQATVVAALAAAETGHLVVSTMSTLTATETVNRIVELFPAGHQRQARATLASSLRGIVSQRLLARADGRGRVLASEILVATNRVFDRILDSATPGDSLEELMDGGEYYGMQTLDQDLFTLCKNGDIAVRTALATATHPDELGIALQQAGLALAG